MIEVFIYNNTHGYIELTGRWKVNKLNGKPILLVEGTYDTVEKVPLLTGGFFNRKVTNEYKPIKATDWFPDDSLDIDILELGEINEC